MNKQSGFILDILYSLFFTGSMIYVFSKQTSDFKIIIIPFIICGIADLGKSIFSAADKLQYAKIFEKIYGISFLLFWFGFLIAEAIFSSRDKNYSMLLFSIPFWIAGIVAFNKFFLGKSIEPKKRFEKSVTTRNGEEISTSYKTVLSAFLVGFALMTGLIMLFFGIKNKYPPFLLIGSTFALVALSFVVAALYVFGYLNNLRIDIMSIYVGAILLVMGIGIILFIVVFKNGLPLSLNAIIKSLGIWLPIPTVFILLGGSMLIDAIFFRNKGE